MKKTENKGRGGTGKARKPEGEMSAYCPRSALPGICRMTAKAIRRLRETGKFPEPALTLPGGRLYWRVDDVRALAKEPDPDRIGIAELSRELGVDWTTVYKQFRDGVFSAIGRERGRGRGGAYVFSRARVMGVLRERGMDRVLADYYTGREFADELGVSEDVLFDRERKGKVPRGVQFFGRRRWPGEVVREFLKNGPPRARRLGRCPSRTDEGLLKISELASLLSLTEAQVWRLARDGWLEAEERTRGAYYFRRERALACLERMGLSSVATDFFSLEELACILKVGRERLRRMIRDGDVPRPVIFFGRKRWPRDQIRDFVNSRKSPR